MVTRGHICHVMLQNCFCCCEIPSTPPDSNGHVGCYLRLYSVIEIHPILFSIFSVLTIFVQRVLLHSKALKGEQRLKTTLQ